MGLESGPGFRTHALTKIRVMRFKAPKGELTQYILSWISLEDHQIGRGYLMGKGRVIRNPRQ